MQKLLEYTQNKSNRVHALSVICGGRELTPPSPSQDKRFPIYSSTKSILSIGVGLLYNDGKLDIESSIDNYLTDGQLRQLPEDKFLALRSVPVTRFLTMSLSGYPFRPEGESGWITQALTADIDYKQPPTFSYSNFPALLVGVAAQNCIDEPLEYYLERRLFTPLGIKKPARRITPEGYLYGASGMELSCLELSRIGVYLLKNAPHDGYLSKAVSPQIKTDKGGYGYFFRVGDGFYYISGKWGQKCIIFPERDTVITYLSDRPEGDEELFELAIKAADDRS